jgi:acetyl esterase
MKMSYAVGALAGLTLAALATPAGAQEKGPPAEIAAELRRLGPVINPPAVYSLYGSLLAKQPTEGVKTSLDISYGACELLF